jgi:hypothetical protein
LGEENTLAEKSQLPIKLLIKRKDFEISAEGTVSALTKELDALAEFTDKVSEKVDLAGEVPITENETAPTQEDVSTMSTADIPVIKPTKSSMDNLRALFNTPWGKIPRSVAEVMKALEINAVPDKITTINLYLTRLVQSGTLRRIERAGKWVYFKLPE